MPRYDDRHGNSTRLYVGHLSSRTRSRDLEDIFSRYGRFLGSLPNLEVYGERCSPWWIWSIFVQYLGGFGNSYDSVIACFFDGNSNKLVFNSSLREKYEAVSSNVLMALLFLPPIYAEFRLLFHSPFAFFTQDFSDPRDADDARYALDGRDVDGSRVIVEFAKGVPRGPGGSREYLGRGPAPGTGRCFNCGIEGHWARDCKAGDWKNKCYHCGDRGHIEKNCPNSPKKVRRGRSYSRSPSPRRGRSQSRSRSRGYSRSPSRSRSRSPPPKRDRSIERGEGGSRRRHRASPSPSKGRIHSPKAEEQSPRKGGTPSPRDGRIANGSDYSRSPNGRNRSPEDDVEERSPIQENDRSRSRSRSFSPRDRGSPVDDNENHGSLRGSE